MAKRKHNDITPGYCRYPRCYYFNACYHAVKCLGERAARNASAADIAEDKSAEDSEDED